MSKRVCAEPGCPTLIDAGTPRCTTHARAKDAARGRRQQRGYDAAHDKLRADWQRRLDQGERIHCWRPDCGKPISRYDWHLGHDDLDRSIYRGPECPGCNLSAAGKQPRAPGG